LRLSSFRNCNRSLILSCLGRPWNQQVVCRGARKFELITCERRPMTSNLGLNISCRGFLALTGLAGASTLMASRSPAACIWLSAETRG
jgi:hypothetical protein